MIYFWIIYLGVAAYIVFLMYRDTPLEVLKDWGDIGLVAGVSLLWPIWVVLGALSWLLLFLAGIGDD